MSIDSENYDDPELMRLRRQYFDTIMGDMRGFTAECLAAGVTPARAQAITMAQMIGAVAMLAILDYGETEESFAEQARSAYRGCVSAIKGRTS